jgi:hypothetical protein
VTQQQAGLALGWGAGVPNGAAAGQGKGHDLTVVCELGHLGIAGRSAWGEGVMGPERG